MGIALIELAGLVVMIPLLSILADGTLPDEGVSGTIVGWTGSTDVDTVVLTLTAVAFGFFVLRAIATLVLRWWIFGRIFEDEAATSARLLHRFLSAPYAYHLRTNSTQLLRTLTFSVDQTYTKVVVGLLTIATELIVAVATVFLLAVSEPLAAVALLCYFAAAYAIINRVIAARSRRVGQRLQQHNADVLKQAGEALGAIKHVQLGAHQDHFVDRLADVRRRSADTKRKLQFLAEVPRQYFELAFVVGIGLMIGAVAAIQGSTSVVASFGLFAVAGFRLLPGLVRISNSNQSLQGALPSAHVGARCARLAVTSTGSRRRRSSDGVPTPPVLARRDVPVPPDRRGRRAARHRSRSVAGRLGGARRFVRRGEEHARRRDHGAAPADVGRAARRRLADG